MLRLLFTLVAAVVIAYTTAEDLSYSNVEPYIFEDVVNATLRKLAEKWAPHDPLVIPNININFEHEIGKLIFEAQSCRITGFSRFWASNIKISMVPPKGNIDIVLDDIHVLCPYYKLDALAVFIPLYGSGFMNLRSSGITFGGTAKPSFGSGGITGLKDLKARFNLTSSDLVISGLVNNEPFSQIVSTATTECFPEFVNTYGERLGLLVGPIIEDILNGILSPAYDKDAEILTPFKGGDTIPFADGTLKYYYEL